MYFVQAQKQYLIYAHLLKISARDHANATWLFVKNILF